MDKDLLAHQCQTQYHQVSTLVLMDSWIKTHNIAAEGVHICSFNPCFNGFMDKDKFLPIYAITWLCVSTLVLMDSWIKTEHRGLRQRQWKQVSTLVLMDSWIKTFGNPALSAVSVRFQPLF